MTTRDAHAAVLTTLGDRLPDLQNEIGRREYPEDLDKRVLALASDLKQALERCGELTGKRRDTLAEIGGELQTGRADLAVGKPIDAWNAFTRAVGRINSVAVDVTHGPVL